MNTKILINRHSQLNKPNFDPSKDNGVPELVKLHIDQNRIQARKVCEFCVHLYCVRKLRTLLFRTIVVYAIPARNMTNVTNVYKIRKLYKTIFSAI